MVVYVLFLSCANVCVCGGLNCVYVPVCICFLDCVCVLVVQCLCRTAGCAIIEGCGLISRLVITSSPSHIHRIVELYLCVYMCVPYRYFSIVCVNEGHVFFVNACPL